ncbi:MAG: DUF4911 domain-containing protein [Desulfamplus sp.]|nr:DUF4911 domain-containing protein [Desulfamplus sp.]
MKTIYKLFRVDKSRIGFLKFIFEAHDGLAVITTLDPQDGLVRFAIAPGCMEDVHAVLADLKKDIAIHEL